MINLNYLVFFKFLKIFRKLLINLKKKSDVFFGKMNFFIFQIDNLKY